MVALLRPIRRRPTRSIRGPQRGVPSSAAATRSILRPVARILGDYQHRAGLHGAQSHYEDRFGGRNDKGKVEGRSASGGLPGPRPAAAASRPSTSSRRKCRRRHAARPGRPSASVERDRVLLPDRLLPMMSISRPGRASSAVLVRYRSNDSGPWTATVRCSSGATRSRVISCGAEGSPGTAGPTTAKPDRPAALPPLIERRSAPSTTRLAGWDLPEASSLCGGSSKLVWARQARRVRPGAPATGDPFLEEVQGAVATRLPSACGEAPATECIERVAAQPRRLPYLPRPGRDDVLPSRT